MNDEFYFKTLGSLTEHLLLQDSISNEDIIGIILDFKVAWEMSEESGYMSGEMILSIMSDMMSEEDAFFIISPWIMDNLFDGSKSDIVYN